MLGPLIPVPQHCAVDAYLELVQDGNTIEGESRDSKWTCVNPETGHTWVQEGIETQVYGEVRDGRVHVSFGNGWHRQARWQTRSRRGSKPAILSATGSGSWSSAN